MRILHTADWHLGKKLYGRDLSVYQDSMVEEIAFIAKTKNVDIVTVAGNVFASNNISGSMVSIFTKAVELITDGGKRAMIVTLGESDDKSLLDGFSNLSKRYNISIITSNASIVDFDENNEFITRPIESGRGYVSYMTKNDERVVVAGLNPASVELKNNETIKDGILKSIDSVTRTFSDDSFNVVVANLDLQLQSEEPNENKLTVNIFPNNTNYIALGGKSKSEPCDFSRNAYYSGATMPVDIYDNKGEKSVIVATIDKETKEVRKEIVRLKSSKKLKKLRCSSILDADNQLSKFEDCLVELTLSLPDPIREQDSKRLFETNPNLIQLNLAITGVKNEKKKRASRIEMSGEELFKNFCLDTTQDAIDNDLVELFSQIIND